LFSDAHVDTRSQSDEGGDGSEKSGSGTVLPAGIGLGAAMWKRMDYKGKVEDDRKKGN